MSNGISRRNFFVSAFSIFIGFFTLSFFTILPKRWKRKFFPLKGEDKGLNWKLGHKVREDHVWPKSSLVQKYPILILGGGISGLCAGYYLSKHQVVDYAILELENTVGGNAVWGKKKWGFENQKFPWAAHYLPLPGKEATYVQELLHELFPQGYEEFLCPPLEEKLFLFGRWQEDLYPRLAASQKDLAEKKRFDDLMDEFRHAIGKDGKKAFAIPLAFSSKDPAFTKYDFMSMKEFLQKHGFSSKRLFWYVEYGLRDDYGSHLANTSAWAGIHYFAARPKPNKNLIWPEGNGYLSEALKKRQSGKIYTQTAILEIRPKKNTGYEILTYHQNEYKVFACEKLIYAMPKFQLPYHLKNETKLTQPFSKWEYSPWLTANLFLDRLPDSLRGKDTAWDNVLYESSSLGYVDNTHLRAMPPEKRIWTFYYPFTTNPKKARQYLFTMQDTDVYKLITASLYPAHPDLDEVLAGFAYKKLAHAMIRPTVGFLSRHHIPREILPNFFLAHSDLSGISIFEEAQYHGYEAAKFALI